MDYEIVLSRQVSTYRFNDKENVSMKGDRCEQINWLIHSRE